MQLGTLSLLIGVAMLVLCGVMAIAPARALAAMRAFPRSRWPGWILTVLTLAWAAVLLNRMPLGPVDAVKKYLWVLTPVTAFLVIRFMDELLSPRALGGLFVLLPTPILEIARWHDSPWRLAVVVFAYALAIKGMALLLSPYLFRETLERALGGRAARLRAVSIAGCAVGALYLVLGGTVLR